MNFPYYCNTIYLIIIVHTFTAQGGAASRSAGVSTFSGGPPSLLDTIWTASLRLTVAS